MMAGKGFTTRPSGRELSACGIAGILNLDGKAVSGAGIAKMIAAMDERENGLGADTRIRPFSGDERLLLSADYIR